MDRMRTYLGITIFWLALSMLGDGFSALVVPVRLAALSDPSAVASVIGLVTFAGLIAAMLVQPIAGAASDALYPRWGRRGTLGIGAVLILVALAAFAFLDTLPGVLVSFVLLMVAASVAQAAVQGFIPDRIEPARRGRASGAKGFADLGGAFVGFLVLGVLVTSGSPVPAVLAVGAVVIVTGLATVALVDEPDRRARPQRPFSFGAAFRIDPRAHPDFVRIVAARFLFLLGVYGIGRFLLLIVADRLGLDPQAAGDEVGGLLAALALISAVAALVGGRAADRWGRPGTMIAGCVVAAAGTALLLVANDQLAFLAFGGLLAIGSGVFSSANWAMASDLVPPEEAGRFLGVANIGTAGAAAAAGLLGPVADTTRALAPGVGYGPIVVLAAASIGLSAAVVRPLIAERDEVDERPGNPALVAAQGGDR